MIVYHGTTEIIEKPDVKHSKKYLDFGKGFYLTTYEEQAKKWAVRKGEPLNKNYDIIMALAEMKGIEIRKIQPFIDEVLGNDELDELQDEDMDIVIDVGEYLE